MHVPVELKIYDKYTEIKKQPITFIVVNFQNPFFVLKRLVLMRHVLNTMCLLFSSVVSFSSHVGAECVRAYDF